MQPSTVFASRCCFTVLCFVLMMVNCGFITKWYFEYQVVVKAGPLAPFDIYFPKLSLCFSMSSLLSRKPSDFFSINSSLFLNKTVSYLKQATPAEEDVIEECVFRDWQVNSILFGNQTQCRDYFSVDKYVMQSYMCYKLTPASVLYSLFDATHTLEQRRLLYQVTMKSPLNLGHKMCPILHFLSVPYHDRVFSEEILPSPRRNDKFILSNHIYEYARKPPPYSRCSSLAAELCFTKCMMNQTQKFGLIHFPASIFVTNDSLVLPDYETKYHGRLFNEIHDEAKNFCSQFCTKDLSCHLTLSVTLITRVPTPKTGHLTFEVQSIYTPVTKYQMEAQTDFISYFTQISSVCSFTAGFSVLSLLSFELAKPNVVSMAVKLLHARVKVASIVTGLRNRRRRRGRSNRSNHEEAPIRKGLFFLSLAIRLVAALACMIQVWEISIEHLKFQTRVQIDYEHWPTQMPPTLSICLFKISDIISVNSKLNPKNYSSLLFEKSLNEQKSALSIIDESYSAEQLIVGCRIVSKERSSLWALTLRERNECLQHFTVTRFLTHDRPCLSFTPRNTTGQHEATMKFAITNPGLFYSLILNETAAQGRLKVILADAELPTASRPYASEIPARSSNRLYLISNQLRSLHSLPFPHDTRCRDQEGTAECRRLCFTEETISRLSSLPYGQVISEQTLRKHRTLRLISSSDLMNPSVNQEWREIEKSCTSRCIFQPCRSHAFKTKVSRSHPSPFKLELAVDSRAHPDEHTRVKARSSLYLMMNQLLCCGNFWLGLVLLDLNPFKTKAMQIRERLINSFNQHLQALYSDLLQLHQALTMTPSSYNHLAASFVAHLSSVKTIKASSLALLLSAGCAFHLHYRISQYMTYPTIMITYSEPDESPSAGYEFSVCSSILETSVPESVESYFSGKMSREQFDNSLDRSLANSTALSLMKRERNKLDSLDTCSFRGLDGDKLLSNETRDVINRLFITHDHCSHHIHSKISTENGFLCHRFGMKPQDIGEDLVPLNRPHTLLILKMRAEKLTRHLSVTVSEKDHNPYYGTLWSPIFVKPSSSMAIKVTYVKYVQSILPKPYHNGFESVASIKCFHDCMNLHLRPFGLGVIGSIDGKSIHDYRYPTKAQMKDNQFQETLQMTKKICRDRCLLTISYFNKRTVIHFTATSIISFSSLKNTRDKKYHYIQFHLARTDSPVIKVFIKRQWSLFQLIIECGSIISIWFGISALFFDPLSQGQAQINTRLIHKIEHLLNALKR